MSKIHAPIIIPTLNRANHLKRCVESLSKCTGVDETSIYISVDYPPNQKYVEGYKSVKKFLNNTQLLSCFKNSYVIYQEKNLGPSRNIIFLKELVSNDFKYYILSEDDNEFSVNFLEYINGGLECFESNEKIISINAMREADWYFQEGLSGSKLYPAYGVGVWIDKEKNFIKEARERLLDKKAYSIKNMIHLFRKNEYCFALYVNGILCSNSGIFWLDGELNCIDSVMTIYMLMSEYFCIVPEKTKSRNWGFDGTGVNMLKVENLDPLKRWKLDDEITYTYRTSICDYDERNDKIANKYLKKNFGKRLIFLSVLEYFVFVLLGFNRDRIIRLKGRLKNDKSQKS